MPFFPVARGPVPREHCSPFYRSKSPALDPFGSRRSRTTVFYRVRAWRGTGPRPTVTRDVFLPSTCSGSGASELRSLGTARDRPSPYGEGRPFFPVARGPVPRDRSRAPGHGEGQRTNCIETRRALLRAHRFHRDQEGSPTGETESFRVSRNPFYNNEL